MSIVEQQRQRRFGAVFPRPVCRGLSILILSTWIRAFAQQQFHYLRFVERRCGMEWRRASAVASMDIGAAADQESADLNTAGSRVMQKTRPVELRGARQRIIGTMVQQCFRNGIIATSGRIPQWRDSEGADSIRVGTGLKQRLNDLCMLVANGIMQRHQPIAIGRVDLPRIVAKALLDGLQRPGPAGLMKVACTTGTDQGGHHEDGK